MAEIPVSFFQKIEADYAVYIDRWSGKPFSEVLACATEICNMKNLHRSLHTHSHLLEPEQVRYLSRFAHPLEILLAYRNEYYYDDTPVELCHLMRVVYEEKYADVRGFALGVEAAERRWYPVLCGALSTMERYAEHGVPGLNPKKMRWEIIDREAIYFVRSGKEIEDSYAPEGKSICATLLCDRNLTAIAQQKGLIF